MPVAPSTAGKAPSSAVGRRPTGTTKGTPRAGGTPEKRTPQSSRAATANVSHQTSPTKQIQKSTNEIEIDIPERPRPRPPDPTLFIRAGTSGVRHLYPIHLIDNDTNLGAFTRSISRLSSRTPSTDICTNVDMIRNVCSSITTLQHFDVSKNDLKDLPSDLSSLIDLESLNCSHNQLTDITDSLEQLKHLKEVDLSFNLLTSIPNVIFTLKSLIRLNCEHNCITKIDNDLLNLKRLKFLVLDNNQLDLLQTIDFGQLKKLEYIHIAHNQLYRFPRGLHRLHHLRNVNLSYNRLTTFPIDLLLVSTLDVLNLSHNLIIKIPPMPIAYKRATMIFSIDLSFNQLTKFYDYLLLIARKIDVSNNNIHILSNDLIKKLKHDIITTRELKIHNNPIGQPIVPSEMLDEEYSKTINVLRTIKLCLEEQASDPHTRQGFKLSIIGPKNSGKTALANCLEENAPLTINENEEEVQERIVHVHQYSFRVMTATDDTSKSPPATTAPPTTGKPGTPSKPNTTESSKIQSQRSVTNTRKRTNVPAPLSKLPGSRTNSPKTPVPPPPPTPILPPEPMKFLPLTIFDFNGSSEYYQHMSPFIDTNALHLICIHTADFHQNTPSNIEDIFNGTFDISSSIVITQLFQLLQLLCEKATKTRAIMILPVATCIDLYDTRPNEDKIEVLDKINKFFKFYLQYRVDRIKQEMELIHSLPTISSSLSDRLKTFLALLNIHIQIESCHSISSLTFQGIDELNRIIQHSVLTQKTIFPHVDRILPTLWAEVNQYIESLADVLPVPYILWDDFANRIVTKHGLPHLLNDIAASVRDEGKILILNEVGTIDRVVFLRPSWLTDLLYSIFRDDILTTYLDYEKNELFSLSNLPEARFQAYKNELIQNGLLHSELLRSLWFNLLYKKEHFHHLWLTIMRFVLVAYPKMNKTQLKRFVHVDIPDPFSKGANSYSRLIDLKPNVDERDEIKFDYAVVPYYLPFSNQKEQQDELKRFNNRLKNIISIRYKSQSLPLGFFHRFSVSSILRLDVIYKKHWNDFIVGEHETKDTRFIMETDHRTYIKCHCGTSNLEKPFEEIWSLLMLILNHCEEMFLQTAPSNKFDRSVQCSHCKEFSFMGEWTTPKELQGIKTKACPSCGENIDTARLVQPNERKRRSEELLRRIRERREKNVAKLAENASQASQLSPSTSTTTQILVPPV
ncbi:unnamed protein product [Adineta steineri]|uniref:Uncharacterized protein n=1 Tax=Adineta steineri TaxID=433720 RepID=A0A814A3V7_9BILA|nr:unnamed protein product [Adineta steineri]CAF1518451.1 unnamed protein product [Adineta steineri]